MTPTVMNVSSHTRLIAAHYNLQSPVSIIPYDSNISAEEQLTPYKY